MNRYDIVDKASGQVTHSYIAEAPMPHQAAWGMEAYDETITDENGNDQVVHHDATYSVVVTDLTADLKAQDIAHYSAMKDKECDDAVKALLAPSEDVTHIMFALFDMYNAMNISGSVSQADQDAAKASLAQYLNLMGQIQALRAKRDADVAAYVASKG